MKSTIKNYNEDKGFGFVNTEFDTGRDQYLRNVDAFVHVSKLRNVPEPFNGRSIEFDVEETSKGLVAVNIRDNQTEYLEKEELRKVREAEHKVWRKNQLEVLLNPIEEAVLEDLSFEELTAFRDQLHKAYDYTYSTGRIEVLEEKVMEFRNVRHREMQIARNVAATELVCVTCSEVKPKADFPQDEDEELRAGYSSDCAVCTEIAANKRQAALDVIKLGLSNMETIKKKDFKDLVRAIFAVENRNWSDTMDLTNRAVISTIIHHGDHTIGYFIPSSMGVGGSSFKISGGKCFSISKWRSKKGNYCSSLQHYRIQGSIDDNFEKIRTNLIKNQQ